MVSWEDSANRDPAEPVAERIPTGVMITSTRYEPLGDYLRRSAATAVMTSKTTKITVPVMASVLV